MLISENTIVILEIYTALIMAFIMLNYIISNRGKGEISKNLMLVFVFSIAATISDAISYTVIMPKSVFMIVILMRYSSACLAILFFNKYYYECTAAKVELSRLGYRLSEIIIMLSIGLWIISLFTGLYYTISDECTITYTSCYVISQILPGAAMTVILINFIYNIKRLGIKEVLLWSSYIIIPIIALPFQKYFTTTVVYIAMLFTIMIIYLNITVSRSLEIRDQRLKSQALTIKLLYSQLKPHFVSNIMITIKRLIKVNPTLAYESISYFIEFFRDLIDLTSCEEMVTVDKEMKLVENYLYLQKLRFDDKLEYEINMQSDNFSIPALSILPFVENAIDHGIRKKISGGKVSIDIYSQDRVNTIIIKDDGVGVTENAAADDNHKHIGISNTKEILKNMCRGEVTIDSVQGEGTTVTITIQ